MKWTVAFICVALCAVSALSLTDDDKRPHPPATVIPAGEFDQNKTTTAKSTTTTTAKTTTTTAKTTTTTAKTTTTTAKTTTTTAKTTTTTPKTTTTTAKTTTTTPKTTTTTPKTTTTTAKSTTTTAKSTTTTATPSPTPTASTTMKAGKYNVTNKDKKVCLMAQMALQIRLEKPESKGAFIVQPDMTKATGSCAVDKVNLKLDFKEGQISFSFKKDSANNTVNVDALSFDLSYPLVKGGSSKYTAANNSVNLFSAKVGHSYSCKSESVFMGNGLYLDVKQDRMQAFNLTAGNEFGPPDQCKADQSDYRVAIAVGVTLLVLIIVVVVAYLLGRRKRTDGYQSL